MFKYVLSIRKCELSTLPKLVSSCTTTTCVAHAYTGTGYGIGTGKSATIVDSSMCKCVSIRK